MSRRSILLPLGDRIVRNLFQSTVVIWLMKMGALERIELMLPWRLLNCTLCVGIARFPAPTNARRTEVDIFGVILVVEARR